MRFPCGRWGKRQLIFHPAPFHPPFRPFAAMVFVWDNDRTLLCRIPGRGWCIPSGRVEGNETGEDAAIREAYEEGGVVVDNLRYLGCYQITERNATIWAEAFTATVDKFVDIPEESESRARLLVDQDDLPCCYHFWDPLAEAVFEHAKDVVSR
jgi:8-oxo-dGTP diphosphatase